MKLRVLAVGNRMPAWVNAGFEEYARRMPREMALILSEIKPEPREAKSSAGTTRRLLQQERKRIASALPAGATCVALDEHGKGFSSVELAQRLALWRESGQDVAFIIGGADGMAPELKQDADLVWSLSLLTLPHGLVRIVLAEQLFRAASILSGHPYHRE